MSKDSDQTETAPRKFTLGPLGSLNQVTKGLAKTICAMANGTLDSQIGARICNGLGIMRACLETQKLEQLEARMDEIADRVARDRTKRCAGGNALMKLHASRIERMLAKVEATLVPPPREWLQVGRGQTQPKPASRK